MALITNKIALQAYRDRIERQKTILRYATVFNESEKVDVQRCYDELLAICDDRLLRPIKDLDFADSTPTQNPAQ